VVKDTEAPPPVSSGETPAVTSAEPHEPAEPLLTTIQSEPSEPLRPTTDAADWTGIRRWFETNGWGCSQLVNTSETVFCALPTSQGNMIVRERSRQMSWNGLDVYLGFAPRYQNGQLQVHPLDTQKNLEPLLAAGEQLPWPDQKPKANPVIVLDPGHGGENHGTRCILNDKFEKEFTLDWAMRLKPLLEDEGWNVFLTRTNDVNLSLTDRVAFAEDVQADFFISLHFNSAFPKEEPSGVETYCLTPGGMPSTIIRGFEDDPTQVFANNSFDPNNLQLALRVHRALLEATGAADRGIRRARFMDILRGHNRPGVQIEGGFLSRREGAQRVNTPEYRQKLAEAIAGAFSL
jgi:N-acetylmuramoyl-L-alanine amidase